MGDPKKQKKKFSRPMHPWRRAQLDEERVLVEEYGLKNKKDLWKIASKLSHFKYQAKVLIAKRGAQAEIEKKSFLEKLQRMSLINAGATIDDVLSLSVKDLLERRLQTMVYRKGLAHTISQARQFIVHGHILVNGQKVNVPSFLVPGNVEELLAYSQNSPLADPEHPERNKEKKGEEVKEEKVKKEKDEEIAEVAE
jgi:small subunit ribosomal protein S4